MVDDSVKTEDAMFVQLKFGSGRTEGAKLEENEYREYAEALLKKYGEKRVTLSKQGKVIVTYTNPNDSVETNDELSLAQKKQVVTELKIFMMSSYLSSLLQRVSLMQELQFTRC